VGVEFAQQPEKESCLAISLPAGWSGALLRRRSQGSRRPDV